MFGFTFIEVLQLLGAAIISSDEARILLKVDQAIGKAKKK